MTPLRRPPAPKPPVAPELDPLIDALARLLARRDREIKNREMS
jgi:hypothetical protein